MTKCNGCPAAGCGRYDLGQTKSAQVQQKVMRAEWWSRVSEGVREWASDHKTPQDVNEVKATETVYYIYNRGMFYVFLKAFLFFSF